MMPARSDRRTPGCNETFRRWLPSLLGAFVLAGCGREEKSCERCGTVVISATGEPSVLVPPLVGESVGRDVSDLIYERLAVLAPGGSPIDPGAYRPGLASRWEPVDSVTWRFHLRPGATWHDGQPVTAEDVRFSFQAYADSAINASARSILTGVSIAGDDDSTVSIRFAKAYPEALFDATYHVRVIPKHLWDSVPRERWGADSSVAMAAGSGPFRLTSWNRGQSLMLERVGAPPEGGIRRVVWRFTEDQEAALNLVLAHEADLLETVVTPAAVQRAAADTTLALLRYAGAIYTFLGFKLDHPILADRRVRRGLTLGIDRAGLVRAVAGQGAEPPPGPLSKALWIWSDSIHPLGFDTAAANRVLDSAGWSRAGDGMRRRAGRALGFDVLVPSTSATRRRFAEGIQEMWRQLGARVTITAVDFPVFQQRLGRRRFDAFIGSWLDEPSPRGLADQWTRAGFGGLNYGRYASPVFDSLLGAAVATADVAHAARLWRQALDTLNADAPAVFLSTPVVTVGVASRRIEGIRIDPFSWLATLPEWRVR